MDVRQRPPAKLILVALGGLLFTGLPAVGQPIQQGSREAVAATEDAVKLIQEDRLREALELLDRAIEEDEEYWEAHYQKGRVLGQLDRWTESRDSLLQAAELNPGHAHTHQLAFIAASNVEDWDTAWDQAIKAQLAGADMRQSLLDIYQKSSPPDDFAIRINAAPVFVADVDSSTALADVDLPINFNPELSDALRTGRATQLEDSAVSQSAFDLIRLQRYMRFALSESNRLAVVLQPGRAKFILAISITDIESGESAGRTAGRSASGYFRLIDIESREVIYRANISISDISATTAIQGRLRRYVTDLAAWLAEREG